MLAPVQRLPETVRKLANRAFELLKSDPHHPSLHMKRVGWYWSVRIRFRHRAVAVELPGGMLWFWIGSHAEYDQLVG